MWRFWPNSCVWAVILLSPNFSLSFFNFRYFEFLPYHVFIISKDFGLKNKTSINKAVQEQSHKHDLHTERFQIFLAFLKKLRIINFNKNTWKECTDMTRVCVCTRMKHECIHAGQNYHTTLKRSLFVSVLKKTIAQISSNIKIPFMVNLISSKNFINLIHQTNLLSMEFYVPSFIKVFDITKCLTISEWNIYKLPPTYAKLTSWFFANLSCLSTEHIF